MSDENPIDAIKARAAELFDDPEERDDYILGRMQRAGYKKGPGEWIRPEDDDEPREDDNEPMTRADWRRIEKERAKKAATGGDGNPATPPKKLVQKKETEKKKDPWW